MSTTGDQTAQAARLWDRMAPRYDRDMRVMEKVWFGGGRAWIGERARGDVLEVAIGTGRNLATIRPT